MVVLHRRNERHLDCKHPEEYGCREFELFCHISPFLAVSAEEARYRTERSWQELGSDLSAMSLVYHPRAFDSKTYATSPQTQPDYLQPYRKPGKGDSSHASFWEDQFT